MRKVVWGLAVFGLLAISMIDVVHGCGDHASFLVIAPHPTLKFEHAGGEESRPAPRPWWIRRGFYLMIREVTDS